MQRETMPRIPFYRDPMLRGLLLQVLLCATLGLLAYGAISTAADHLARSKAASGFGFWNVTAGFDISQALIDYSSVTSTYGRAFWVGLLNTLLVAGLGIVFATVIGFTVGIARLSKNFLVERLATSYVELIRNVPLLLQLLFWYNAVLKALPEMSMSLMLPGGIILNNRGLFTPRPLFADGWHIVALVAAASSTSRAACTCESGTPGFARPTIFNHQRSLSFSSEPFLPFGSITGCMLSGTNKSGESCIFFAPVKPRGFTPAIVSGVWFTVMVCPSTAGERPNSRSHTASLITATAPASGKASSVA